VLATVSGVVVSLLCAVVALAALGGVVRQYRAKVRAECACAHALDETAAIRLERDQALATLQDLRRIDQREVQAQKMEAVGRLAGGIAHDFNNLLTAITGYTELLITAFETGDKRLQDAYEIRRAALAASRLTGHLLAFSRNQRVSPEVLDLNTVVARTVGMLKRTLGDHIEMLLDLDPTARLVKADRGHLEQVVLNLAINARDAMPHGGRLQIKTAMAGDYVRMTVLDTGCGIPQAIQSKVFDPFFTTKGALGTGIGLATVYGIVEQNGGSISVASIEGQGTTFTIDLPATDEPIVMPEPPSAPRVVEGCATVLLVEDDPRVRSLAELILHKAGHDVVTTGGPIEAIAALKAQSDIDLVITDIVMPDMNGFDLAMELRRIAPGIRLVFMSGFTSDHFKRTIDDPFLMKPFTVESLTNVVDQALNTVTV
jgi:two-component system cell cycle sensor histidine kinase/response regulator CckA